MLHAKMPQYLCYCMLHSQLQHKSSSKILTFSGKAFNYGQKFSTSTLEKNHYLNDWTPFSPDSVPTPMTRVSTTVSSVMLGPSMAIPCAMLCFTSSWLWELSANWARTVAFDKSISSRKKNSASLQHKHHLWGKITFFNSKWFYLCNMGNCYIL